MEYQKKKIIDFLRKNKNFFIKNSDLVKDLNFPLSDNSSDKVVDLGAYRYKKISQQTIDLQNFAFYFKTLSAKVKKIFANTFLN